MQKNRNLIVVVLMVTAVVIRFLNVVPNFSPVVGLTLFGAALLNRKSLAFILPLFMVYFSDLIINNTIARGFYPEVEGIVWFSDYMIWNALAYIGIAAFGYLSLSGKLKFSNTILVTFLSSIIFFLVTNFGSWLDPKMLYPKSLDGLWLSYGAAIPFFRTSLISDLLFSGALFGSYFLIERFFLIKSDSTVQA